MVMKRSGSMALGFAFLLIGFAGIFASEVSDASAANKTIDAKSDSKTKPASKENRVILFPIVQDGKWGYMDETGKVIIKPQYSAAFDFSEGLAVVEKTPFRGYIDKTGKEVTEFIYTYAGPFKEGLACVIISKSLYGGYVNYYGKPHRMTFIDKSGKVNSNLPPSIIGPQEGILVQQVRRKPPQVLTLDGKKLETDAEDITRFSGGIAPAKKGKLWGFINRDMTWLLEPTYHEVDEFSEGFAAVGNFDPAPPKQKTGRVMQKWKEKMKSSWGFVDTTGKVVVELKYEDCWKFSEGLAPVKKGGKWGYIDKMGKEVIEPRFDYAWPFSEGMARIMVGEQQGFIDKTGTLVIEPRFRPAWEFSKGLARVAIDRKEGYINKQGKYVWEPSK